MDRSGKCLRNKTWFENQRFLTSVLVHTIHPSDSPSRILNVIKLPGFARTYLLHRFLSKVDKAQRVYNFVHLTGDHPFVLPCVVVLRGVSLCYKGPACERCSTLQTLDKTNNASTRHNYKDYQILRQHALILII